MKDKEKKTELHLVGEDDGITEIPDDTPGKRAEERKRKLARLIRRIDSKRTKNGARLSPIGYGIVAVLILVFVFIVADISSGGFLYTVNGRFVSLFSDRTSSRFSVDINADNIYDFKAFDNGYMILTENGISYIEKLGNTSSSQQLTYSSPSVEINNKRVIVYDRGNTSYTLMQSETLYSQQKTDTRIIDAAVSAKENYAIAVRDENANSILYGMDARGKIIYQWNCPDGYISDISITSSGSKVAATVIDAENAALYSTVYILDFEYDTAYAQFEYKNETVLGAKFLSNRKIQVVTDKNVYCISGKDLQVVYEYGTSDICFSDFSDKYTAVVTKDYSHDDSYTLSLFAKNGKLRFSVPLSGKVRGLSVSDKSVAVLFSDKTETYSKRGKLVGTVENINHYEDIVINGNYVYVLSSDSVKKFPAYGNISNSVIEEATD